MDWGTVIAGGGGVTSLVLAILFLGTGEKPRWYAGSIHREQIAEKDKRFLDMVAEKDKRYLDMVAEKDKQIAHAEERADRAATLTERTVAVAEAMMIQIREQAAIR